MRTSLLSHPVEMTLRCYQADFCCIHYCILSTCLLFLSIPSLCTSHASSPQAHCTRTAPADAREAQRARVWHSNSAEPARRRRRCSRGGGDPGSTRGFISPISRWVCKTSALPGVGFAVHFKLGLATQGSLPNFDVCPVAPEKKSVKCVEPRPPAAQLCPVPHASPRASRRHSGDATTGGVRADRPHSSNSFRLQRLRSKASPPSIRSARYSSVSLGRRALLRSWWE